jgi:NitT/TauT family transport system substrate-binding protein
MLTSRDLDAFTKDGTVIRWLSDCNTMFQTFGTVKEPLAPEKFYTADLFTSA